MEIIIENISFPYDIGCRVIKAKYTDCPFEELAEIWEDIKPVEFKEIAQKLPNLEQRRIAINCLGIDKLVKEIEPVLLDSRRIEKTTAWVKDDGTLETREFVDTYELYQVDSIALGLNNPRSSTQANYFHYIRCKDTSTDREYLLWVDASSVYRENSGDRWGSSSTNWGERINAIQAIAWTIQTDIEQGSIEKIIRQGDCILIKEKPKAKRCTTRHLTEQEYRELLVAES